MKLSKSKLALAKVINENGGWDDDSANWAVQPKHENGDVWFSTSKNKPYSPSGGLGFTFKGQGYWLDYSVHYNKVLPNWHQCVLSREEYYQAYPKYDADGWIEWKGGECPVGKGTLVDVKYANGIINFGVSSMTNGSDANHVPGTAVSFTASNWGGDLPLSGIISYRLHLPEVKHEFCESVTRSIPEPDNDDAESRIAKALELVKEAAPHLLSDKYKFNGDEVMGERKPTIEKLAQDYRNAKDYADRLQKEAGEAAVKAESFAVEIRKKIIELQELIEIPKLELDPEFVITDWRDLQAGDVVEITGSDNGCWEEHSGMEMTVENVYPDDGDNDDQVDLLGQSGAWSLGGNTTWRFIRRP